MCSIISIDGDRWDSKNPNVISGHIHKNQTINNIYYPGSSMQVSFGETDRNIISSVEFNDDERCYILNEIEIDLPRKKIVYIDVDDFDSFDISKNKNNENDKVKVSVSGSYEEFKTLKKTKKYKDMVDNGNIQVVFKTKKKELKRIKEHLSEQIENQKNNNEDGNGTLSFQNILSEFIKNEKNPYLFETYEFVINNKLVKSDDVIYL
jgi:acylphosphatase